MAALKDFLLKLNRLITRVAELNKRDLRPVNLPNTHQVVRTLCFFFTFLFVFFIARLALLMLYTEAFSSLTPLQTFFSFIEGIRFDLASTTVLLAIPILLLNLPFRFVYSRYWFLTISWFIFPILIVIAGTLVGDVAYFDFVKRHASYEILTMRADDFRTVVGMSIDLFLPFLIIFVVFIGLLAFFWKKLISKPIKVINSWKSRWGLFLVIFITMVIIGRGGFGKKPITIIDAFASGNSAYGNLVLNGVFSISHSSLKWVDINHHFFSEDKALSILFPEKQVLNKKFPLQKFVQKAEKQNYNLVFVLIESLSIKYVDVFASQGYGVTQNLDAVAQNGLMFTNFYAAGQRSVEGIQATLTGMPSIVGLPTISVGILANYSKLGHIAKDNGYSTLFVQSLKKRSFRNDAMAGSTGFLNFYGMEDMPILLDYPDKNAAKYGWDYETYMFALDKIDKIKKPFLTYILTSTTHTPYPRLPNGLEKYPHSKSQEEGFLNTINYTDWSIGQFLAKAKKRSWFDKTIFIFTADHALAHYQSGGFRGRFQIPLIIYAPKIFKPKTINKVASQLDIFDTIIDILDFNGKYTSLGRSLLSDEESIAMIRAGSSIGIFSDNGYLRHSLNNRLETGTFNDHSKKVDFDAMEKKLLAADQLTYELLQSNRWAE